MFMRNLEKDPTLETTPSQPAPPPISSPPPLEDQGHASTEGLSPKRKNTRIWLPIALFVATCLSTFWTGAADWSPETHLGRFDVAFWDFWQNLPQGFIASLRLAAADLNIHVSQGLIYMAGLMVILLTHEFGHFAVAWWYKIPASLPYFIPLPILPFGTMGSVIGMEDLQANRRQMFDLGLVGPLAGLLLAIPITWAGVMSLPATPNPGAGWQFHNPLILQLMIEYLRPDYPTPMYFYLSQFNAYLMAGWMGMFITGLNMLPISQLDGGHVAYSLLDQSARTLARTVLVLAILLVLYYEQYNWMVMLIIIIFLGIEHPATADDSVQLNPSRRILGWLALLIPILCLSPIGISQPIK
jgi:Zn-dependent protease